MGVKSTVGITKENAIAYIMKKVCTANYEQLALMMEMLYGDELMFNYTVCDSEEESYCPYKFSDVREFHDHL